MPKGGEAVHYPDVLVIMSGLSYDIDLSFIRGQPVKLSFERKLVFELHWYCFSDGNPWTSGNPNQVCGKVTESVMNRAGYLLNQGHPLIVSEFGIDLSGTNENDNRYFNCFMALAAGLDYDFSLWTMAGSYYLREGKVGTLEPYGILSPNTSQVTNPSFLQRLSAIQLPYQGISLTNNNNNSCLNNNSKKYTLNY